MHVVQVSSTTPRGVPPLVAHRVAKQGGRSVSFSPFMILPLSELFWLPHLGKYTCSFSCSQIIDLCLSFPLHDGLRPSGPGCHHLIFRDVFSPVVKSGFLSKSRQASPLLLERDSLSSIFSLGRRILCRCPAGKSSLFLEGVYRQDNYNPFPVVYLLPFLRIDPSRYVY